MMIPIFDMRVINRVLELQSEAEKQTLDRSIERLRAEWQEALSRTLKSPTFEEWLKAKQAQENEA